MTKPNDLDALEQEIQDATSWRKGMDGRNLWTEIETEKILVIIRELRAAQEEIKTKNVALSLNHSLVSKAQEALREARENHRIELQKYSGCPSYGEVVEELLKARVVATKHVKRLHLDKLELEKELRKELKENADLIAAADANHEEFQKAQARIKELESGQKENP